ncbi:hypothetical protein JTE90_011607 [Oedothorax gibbosus]|uniref:Uncharacterized protein n=1 Tax=Oedothorax gibbosus TaxID=931172 RepID=A0AAV6U3I8_9ARAC|nr:hypothetical protein JTE90_011607 [Oedothorax gibbosus]
MIRVYKIRDLSESFDNLYGAFHAVEILDTSGSLNFPAMRDLSIRSGRGFVLVFSVDNAHTFDEAVELWDHILRLRGDKVPVVLVGNKTDLVLKRQVTEEMVRAATQERSPCRYVETSAKSNSNVALLFQELLEHAEELERPPAPPPGSRRLSRRLSSIGTVNFSLRRSSVPREGQEKDKKMRADSKSCTIM